LAALPDADALEAAALVSDFDPESDFASLFLAPFLKPFELESVR